HYLLMKRAKELGVTVLLSGQGADESLCGYKKYLGFQGKHVVCSGHYAKRAGRERKPLRLKKISRLPGEALGPFRTLCTGGVVARWLRDERDRPLTVHVPSFEILPAIGGATGWLDNIRS